MTETFTFSRTRLTSHRNEPTNWDPYQSAIIAAPSDALSMPMSPAAPAGAEEGPGLDREVFITAVPYSETFGKHWESVPL